MMNIDIISPLTSSKTDYWRLDGRLSFIFAPENAKVFIQLPVTMIPIGELRCMLLVIAVVIMIKHRSVALRFPKLSNPECGNYF